MSVRIIQGDCRDVLKTLPDESVHCVVTSPPYWRQRDYGKDLQIGLEPTPEGYIADICIAAGCPAGGTVLDPFGGAGTTGLVADRLGRNAILIELNPTYAEMAERRLRGDAPLFAEIEQRAAS